MQLSENNQVSRFKSIAKDLSRSITSGVYVPGDMFPSVRKLAEEYDASVGTVRRAITELETRGLVRNAPRQGCIVADVSSTITKPKNLLVVLGEEHLGMDVSLWGTKIFLGIQSECVKQGYGVTTMVGSDHKALRENVEQGLFDKIAGVIGLAEKVPQWFMQAVERADIPSVVFDSEVARPDRNHVMTDHFGSAKRVGEYFAQLDCKDVWLLGKKFSQAAHEAYFGLLDAYLDADKSPESIRFVRVRSGCNTQEDGIAACRELFSRGERPDAIFSCNDHVAMGAVKACQQFGLDVPGDVGVVGATGLEQYAHTTPSLSVMAQPMSEIGRMCVCEVDNLIETNQSNAPVRRLRGELILRDTFTLPAEMLHKTDRK